MYKPFCFSSVPFFKYCVSLLCLLIEFNNAEAQDFKLMRYDENYGRAKDSVNSFYRNLKFIPLGTGKKAYLSLGDEVREEYDAFRNEDWGKNNLGNDNFFLQRYDFHFDLHLSNGVRIFGQLRSALENGRPTGPRQIDMDQLNVQNLFIDVDLLKNAKDTLTLRTGRQELNYGAGRLISVREGPNARLYFDGVKFLYKYKRLSIDAFAVEAANVKTGIFDDAPTRQINLWALYATIAMKQQNNIDFYYIGNRKDSIVYNDGSGREVRHTIGARLWKNNDGLVYDVEAAYQFGRFNSGIISAWTASFDLGYIFGDLESRPAIGIRNDYISGDSKQGDGSLQTFNPIYPKGGYFGFDPQVGPVNLIDLHPYASVHIFRNLNFLGDVVFNWRYSLNDGIYRPSGTFNLTGSNSDKRYIGTDYLAKVIYAINPFLSMDFGIQYFVTGSFINSEIVNHKDAVLTNSRISFKF
jgi:hypothetical protein